MCIWQLDDWQSGKTPAFHWQDAVLQPLLKTIEQQQHLLASHISISKSQSDEAQKAQFDALVQNALRTSEIEGETLNLESVRSSVIEQASAVLRYVRAESALKFRYHQLA